MKTITFTLAVTAVASLLSGASMEAQAQTKAKTAAKAAAQPPGCETINGLSFVCGIRSPEDATPIPGTKWIIAGGRKPGAGLTLVDTVAKTGRPMFTGAPAQMQEDRQMYPTCPEPLNAKTWIAHGVFLRPAKQANHYALYIANDGPLQSVQIFDVDTTGAEPSLTWKGCIPTPPGDKAYANLTGVATSERLGPNSVAAFSDGSILVSIPRRPGTTPVQRFNGSPTGDVLEWKPGWGEFRVMQGVQVPYANGIEISSDETEFYVAAYSAQKVMAFNRADSLGPVRELPTPGIMPDNLRWSGNRLLVGGMVYDEPACGGSQASMNGSLAQWSCHRGYVVAEINPKTAAYTLVAYSEPHPGVNVVATGIIMGDTLWIGASNAEGLAYRPLPRPAPVAAPMAAPAPAAAPAAR